MPYESTWSAPELFLEHRGVKVFCTYKDDEASEGPSDYWFTPDPSNEYAAYERVRFDVRTLDVPARKRLQEEQPPFMNDDDERYRGANAEERARIANDWERWHDGGERAIIETIVREAIDAGLISAHVGADEALEEEGGCTCGGGCSCQGALPSAPAGAGAAPQYSFGFDNTECRDVLNAVAAWTDSLKQRGLRASERVGKLLQRLIDDTKAQDAARARRPGPAPAAQSAGAAS